MKLQTKQEKHSHDYKTIKLVRIDRVQAKYKGTAGDKAMLTRVCECGDEKAFDMGSTAAMETKHKQLTK